MQKDTNTILLFTEHRAAIDYLSDEDAGKLIKKLVNGYIKAVGAMYNVESTEELKPFSFLHYEKLKYQCGDPKSSVRLVNGMVERLLFVETDDGIEVELIEIDSTHYGNKK